MNLLQRIGKLFERRAMTDSQFFELHYGGGGTYAGPSVNEANAMRASAVYACIHIISESIASLPLVLYRQSGRNKERATNHRLYSALHDMANPNMTAFEWRELAFSHVLAWGNHWSQITIRDGKKELWPLNPSRMEGYEWRGPDLWWLYRESDQTLRKFPSRDIHHIKGLGDGIIGISPIMQAAKQAIGLSLATEEFGARFFSNGARPGVLLKHPGKLSDSAYNRLKASYTSENGGLSNAHKVKILEEGMDIATIGIPPNEAQFLETRKFQVTEIARIYRVPPHMLADLDRATFSNIEHQSLSFVMHTLMPWLVRHEQAIYRDLLSEDERKQYFAKYVVAGLLRGDTAARYGAYTTAINTGFMTRNEARELEDLNPIDGLDEPLLPLNMAEANNPPQPEPTTAPTRTRALLDIETRGRRAAANRVEIMNRHVRVFEDAASRLVKREVSDIRKAAKSKLGKRSVDSFRTWLEGFYSDLRNVIPDYFRAIMETYAETIMAAVADELDGEPVELDDELREWIEGYLANFTEVYAVAGERQLRSLLAEAENEEDAASKIEERLTGWEENRAQKTALEQAFEAGNALAIYGYVAAGVGYLVWRATSDSCPLCQKMDGKRIKIGGSFLNEGDEVTADGVDPLPIVRKIKHGPLHSGCDCQVVAG